MKPGRAVTSHSTRMRSGGGAGGREGGREAGRSGAGGREERGVTALWKTRQRARARASLVFILDLSKGDKESDEETC